MSPLLKEVLKREKAWRELDRRDPQPIDWKDGIGVVIFLAVLFLLLNII